MVPADVGVVLAEAAPTEGPAATGDLAATGVGPVVLSATGLTSTGFTAVGFAAVGFAAVGFAAVGFAAAGFTAVAFAADNVGAGERAGVLTDAATVAECAMRTFGVVCVAGTVGAAEDRAGAFISPWAVGCGCVTAAFGIAGWVGAGVRRTGATARGDALAPLTSVPFDAGAGGAATSDTR